MNLHFTSFNVDSAHTKTLPEREIFWPTALGYGSIESTTDSKSFPEFAAIKARRSAQNAQPLSVFETAIRQAQDTVLILDDYLLNPALNDTLEERLNVILKWFEIGSSAKDIRLLTSGFDKAVEQEIQAQFHEHATLLNQVSQYPEGINIQIRFSLQKNFPYVHDRFAILDNELWHFGATVGGLHRDVNAASRGWNATECGAKKFFDMAWAGDKGLKSFMNFEIG